MKSMVLKKNKKGFTLVELVIVIAVLAILAAIAIPTVTNVIDTANKNVDAANAQTIELALKTTDAELQAGTWNGKFTDTDTARTATTINVGDALKHQGINALPAAKVSGAQYRSINGKVSLSSSTADGAIFDVTSTASTVLSNAAAGTK